MAMSLVGPETMPFLLGIGTSHFMISLQFYNSLLSYMTLQRNKVSKTLTCTNVSVLSSKRRAVVEFVIGGPNVPQIFFYVIPYLKRLF